MRLILLPALIATLLLGPIGCSYDSYDKPIRWYPDRHAGTAVDKAAPRSGEYTVAVQSHDGWLRPWQDVTVRARDGDRLGFEHDGEQLFATYSTTRQALGVPPDDALYVAWATSENRLGPLDRPVRAAGTGLKVTGKAVLTGAVVVLGGAALVGLVWLSINDSDDDDPFDR
ncbi:MAG: hypothetical protein AAGI46_06955 [Planctomycetota bacterium]